MTKPGPSVTSGADTQPGSDSLFPSGFGGGAAIRTGGVGTVEIADGSVAAADLNFPSVAAALAARTEFTGTYGPLLATGNRDAVAIYDEFSRYADGALAGKTPVVGSAWLTTGANPTTVASGKATSSGVGYAYAQLSAAPVALACEVGFTGGTSGAMTMAWSTSTTFDLLNLLHANFGPNGYTVTVRQDGGTFDVLMSGNWSIPMLTDGTVYRVTVAVRRDRFVIYGPSGDVYASVPDPRVRALWGTWVFWEPNTTGGTVASLSSVFAYSRASSGYLGGALQPDLIAGAATANDGIGRIWGSPGNALGVAVGRGNSSGQPAITFGAPTYYTALSASASIGASTVSLRESVPSGTVLQIESGNGSESVTTTGTPTGTGPYVATLTGTLTKAHASGVAVVGAAPASRQTEMYLNQSNGFFFLPNLSVVCVQQNLYFGTGLDVNISRSAAGVLAMGSTQTFRTGTGGLKIGASGATHFSGSGAPTIAGTAGDWYWRTDTPSTANQRAYICTTTGGAGVAVWAGVI